MKAMGLLGYVCLVGSALAAGGSLSEADRKDGVAYLERTRAEIVRATKGLSEAQLNFKPGPDRWSVAEVLEHIALTEDLIFGEVTTKVMQGPAGPADRDYKSLDRMVLGMIPDRSQKFKAPEPVQPKGKPAKESLDHFLKSRKRTIEYMKNTAGLRDHVMDSPLGKQMDGYQWLLFIAGHSDRHLKQILEVKADANFPGK